MTIEFRQYLESARNIEDCEKRIQLQQGKYVPRTERARVIREMGDTEAEELVNSLIREAIVEHNRNVYDPVFDG